jgi:creatinine amidohydrolase
MTTSWPSISKIVLAEVDIIVYPTINYFYFPPFTEYPGSTTVGFEAAKHYLRDLILSIAHNGPRKFYILNTGISTVKPIGEVASDLKEKNLVVEFTDLRKFEKDIHLEQAGGTHADEGETSLMLYIAPQIVHQERAVRDFNPDAGDLSPTKKAKHTYSPTGAWGDPTLATIEKGKKIEAAYFRGILADIKNLRAR